MVGAAGRGVPRMSTNIASAVLMLLSLLAAAGSSSMSAEATGLLPLGGATTLQSDLELRMPAGNVSKLCPTPARSARTQVIGGIPDGAIATASGTGLVCAWYSEPTVRYPHGVLGDRVEAGALEAVDAAGRHHTVRLDQQSVFEDLTPRLADLDGNGAAEVVTIRSKRNAGAAVAVHGLRDGRLVEIAATLPIGSPNRWLNIAGIADLTGDGQLDIALVKTPHIGGRLEVWTLRDGSLARVGSADGFSNHVIGSTDLGLSAIADADGDGVVDLALPDAWRTSWRIVSVRDGLIRDLARIAVSGRITGVADVTGSAGRPTYVVGLEDGRTVVIPWSPPG